MERPNLFDYATSELSQDAFFAWLLKWASHEYLDTDSELSNLGRRMLSRMTGIDEDSIRSVEVGRQWENIDIWVEVNDDTFVVIEDKTGTAEHDNQLERYRKTAEDWYAGKRDRFHCVYLKTGNEPASSLKAIEERGYGVFSRRDVLDILASYSGDDSIVKDFTAHLESLENDTASFRMLPMAEWPWHAWEGFYMELEKWYPGLDWRYVANPSGGFLGAWWHFVDAGTDDVEMYFQIEQGRFCFKLSCGDGISDTRTVRTRFFEILLDKSVQHGIDIVKPARFGNGYTMTVGILQKPVDCFGDGTALRSLLDNCCSIVDECVEEFDRRSMKASE